MRRIPVDVAALGTVLGLQVDARTRRENGVESQRTDAEGRPQWSVSCLVQSPDSAPELLLVNVTSAVAPVITPMTPLTLVGAVAVPWSMGDRSGVSFQADAVESVAPVGQGRKDAA